MLVVLTSSATWTQLHTARVRRVSGGHRLTEKKVEDADDLESNDCVASSIGQLLFLLAPHSHTHTKSKEWFLDLAEEQGSLPHQLVHLVLRLRLPPQR